jgi:hypothetical protein
VVLALLLITTVWITVTEMDSVIEELVSVLALLDLSEILVLKELVITTVPIQTESVTPKLENVSVMMITKVMTALF